MGGPDTFARDTAVSYPSMETIAAYYVVMPAPVFQAQLDRIEAMLKRMLGEPMVDGYDARGERDA